MAMIEVVRSRVVLMSRKGDRKTKRQQPSRPGMEGRFQEGERMVVDPTIPGRPETKKVNVRASWVDYQVSRGKLDPSEEAACNKFCRMCELAQIGRLRGIDFEASYSSGAVSDPLTDEIIWAGRGLAKLHTVLGMVRFRFLTLIVGQEQLVSKVAAEYAEEGLIEGEKSAQGYVTGTVFDAIKDLVDFWKLEGQGAPVQRPEHYYFNGEKRIVFGSIRASGPMSYTGPAREISVGKFGDVIIEEKRGVDRGPLTPHTSGNIGGRASKK